MGSEYMTLTGLPCCIPGFHFKGHSFKTLMASSPVPWPISRRTFTSVTLPSFSMTNETNTFPFNPGTLGIL